MKLLALFVALVAAFPIQKQPLKITLVSSHAGNADHITAIKKVDSKYVIGGDEGTPVTLTLSPDGTISDMDGSPVIIDDTTGLVTPGTGTPTNGFSIYNNYLIHKSMKTWHACPNDDTTYTISNNCPEGVGIELYITKKEATA